MASALVRQRVEPERVRLTQIRERQRRGRARARQIGRGRLHDGSSRRASRRACRPRLGDARGIAGPQLHAAERRADAGASALEAGSGESGGDARERPLAAEHAARGGVRRRQVRTVAAVVGEARQRVAARRFDTGDAHQLLGPGRV